MAQVFISYSRRDREFVQSLVAALHAEKREVWLDEKDIEVTVEWLKEIFRNIEAADNFLFVISPESVVSANTRKEIDHAVANSKRMVPIYYRAVPDDGIPEAVAKFQRIDFSSGTDFDSSFAKLTQALDTDLDWKQTHTRLLTRAREWERNEADSSFLLRGKDLRDAERWIVRSTEQEPKPTTLHSQYIFASRQAATKTQRIIFGAVAIALAFAIGLAIYAFIQRNTARAQKEIADGNAAEATRQKKAAEKFAAEAKRQQIEAKRQEGVAETETATAQRNAREAKARELTAFSTESLNDDPEKSILLGMTAVNATLRFGESPVPAAEDALHRAILSSQLRETLRGHKGNVFSVAWSPDGKRLATGSDDRTAKVWDSASGQELLTLTLRGHSDLVTTVAWSPDGKRLATGNDKTAKVWDSASGQELLTLRGHSDLVTTVAWSPDGKRLATGSNDQTAKVWNSNSGQELLTLKGHTMVVSSVAWSPDGNRLATASYDATAKVWDSVSGQELLALKGLTSSVSSVAWSPDGKRLATANLDRTVRVWDSASGQESLTLRGLNSSMLSVAWSPDGTRDLVLLSATPHQGDHFRFWMLVQMLDPTLFNSPVEMVQQRHRLNTVIVRRTKADACRPDGSTLFARRQVFTESFTMSTAEKVFYEALVLYLQDGFALAKRQGKRGQGLAFVMTIFQKIAASSFAAVQRTLRRRLIALTVQEALMHDQRLDIDQRNAASDEARTLIRELHDIAVGRLGDAEVERILADYRYKVLRQQREEEDALGYGADEFASETAAAAAEDAAATSVSVALPEERRRIKELLGKYPSQRETKVEKLIGALGELWRQNPQERMVVFATYLGSVEMLGMEIDKQYPGQGVTVLKGGDHGAKTAAEKRFKATDGPRVLICTAAGREGINLQHARVLFNFDLPWNPMDLEQRIGRIHRYGQQHTAQIYNLVLADTIEGSIFLLLNEKLTEIGKALGKVDERGEIAEDLRIQILGQLSMEVNYATLYSAALSDPLLKRTKFELDTAMSNAVEARKVVFELFQDLDGFRLDDYKALGESKEGMDALIDFISEAAKVEQGSFSSYGDKLFVWKDSDSKAEHLLTTERETSLQQENVALIGLDHPTVAARLIRYRDVPPEELGVRVASPDGSEGILAAWAVEARGDKGHVKRAIVALAVDAEGKRLITWERHPERLWRQRPLDKSGMSHEARLALLKNVLEPMLQREIVHKGLDKANRGFEAKLIAWVEATKPS